VEIFSKVGIHSYTVDNWQEMEEERSSKKNEGGRARLGLFSRGGRRAREGFV
jgi:hypothetical protein